MRAVMALASHVLVLDHGTAIAAGRPMRWSAIRRSVRSYLGAEMIWCCSVEDLDLYYGDVQALDACRWKSRKAPIVAIVGANGAGKTTLIRALAGMLPRPRAGSCFADTISRACRATRLSARHRSGGRRPADVSDAFRGREPRHRRACCRRARAQRARKRERVLYDVSRCWPSGRGSRRHVVRRRAADARDRPLPDGRAAADHVR